MRSAFVPRLVQTGNIGSLVPASRRKFSEYLQAGPIRVATWITMECCHQPFSNVASLSEWSSPVRASERGTPGCQQDKTNVR